MYGQNNSSWIWAILDLGSIEQRQYSLKMTKWKIALMYQDRYIHIWNDQNCTKESINHQAPTNWKHSIIKVWNWSKSLIHSYQTSDTVRTRVYSNTLQELVLSTFFYQRWAFSCRMIIHKFLDLKEPLRIGLVHLVFEFTLIIPT